jgi:FixJ family two-component response regulator
LINVATEEKPKVVAIVDDDESIRAALHGLMKAAGFAARAFASAEEYLNSGEQKRTACLIADIRMPGMSGLEKMRMQALRAGAVEFLTKPFDDEALVDSVRAALDT